MSYDKNLESQLEKQIIDLLKDRRDGVSSDDLSKSTQEVDGLLRGHVVNKMLAANTIEMLQSKGSGTFLLRLKRGAQIDGSQEEQLVCSLLIFYRELAISKKNILSEIVHSPRSVNQIDILKNCAWRNCLIVTFLTVMIAFNWTDIFI